MSILFMLLCIFINRTMRQVLMENVGKHAQITDEKLANQFDFLYDKIDVFSMSLAGQEDVQQLMEVNFSKKLPYINAVEEMIAYYKTLDPEIVDISFVNEEVHYSTMYTYKNLDEMYSNSKEKIFLWLGIKDSDIYSSTRKTPMLVYARQIISNGNNVGSLLISIDISALRISSTDEMNSYYLLADEEGIRYSFNSTEEDAQEIWRHWKKNEKERESGESWYIRDRYLEKMNCWQICALDQKQIGRQLGKLQFLVWNCVVLTSIFSLLFFWMIKREVVKPLEEFHGIIRTIRSQKQRRLKEGLHLEGCLEIREIGSEFTGMMQDISQLNQKIFDAASDLYEMKIKKQEAELSYMRSQIDPHFLYNTLEVFRREAIEKNAPELAQMAVDMGKIFRYSTKGDPVVSLEEEISIIKSYVRIQKNRFQGKIEVFYFITEDALRKSVMKMLLQPIVENAIYHGLEPKEECGMLYIGARVEEKDLVMVIKDDGVGFDSEKLKEIQKLLEQDIYDTSKHVGILNTQARIRLQYGEKYGIQIESSENAGTTVIMRIPAEEQKEAGE